MASSKGGMVRDRLEGGAAVGGLAVAGRRMTGRVREACAMACSVSAVRVRPVYTYQCLPTKWVLQVEYMEWN